MFKFLRKKTTSAAVNSFMRRFATLVSLHQSGKLSETEYQRQRRKVIMEYQNFIATTPPEFLPEYVKNIEL